MSAATPIATTDNQSNKSAQKMKFAVESPAELCYDEVAVNEADSLKGDNPMRKSETKICALYAYVIIGINPKNLINRGVLPI